MVAVMTASLRLSRVTGPLLTPWQALLTFIPAAALSRLHHLTVNQIRVLQTSRHKQLLQAPSLLSYSRDGLLSTETDSKK